VHVALHHIVDDIAHHFVAAGFERLGFAFLKAGFLDAIYGFDKPTMILRMGRYLRIAPGNKQGFLAAKMIFGEGDQAIDQADGLFLLAGGKRRLDRLHQVDDGTVIAVDFGNPKFESFQPFHVH